MRYDKYMLGRVFVSHMCIYLRIIPNYRYNVCNYQVIGFCCTLLLLLLLLLLPNHTRTSEQK